MTQSTTTVIPPLGQPEEVLTISGVARLLHRDPRTIRRYIRDAGLPAHQPGRVHDPVTGEERGTKAPLLFVRADVLDWLRNR